MTKLLVRFRLACPGDHGLETEQLGTHLKRSSPLSVMVDTASVFHRLCVQVVPLHQPSREAHSSPCFKEPAISICNHFFPSSIIPPVSHSPSISPCIYQFTSFVPLLDCRSTHAVLSINRNCSFHIFLPCRFVELWFVLPLPLCYLHVRELILKSCC